MDEPVREATGKAGRKPVPIDLTELEKLCALQCTDEEIAGWFGVSTCTIESRKKRRDFAQAMQRGRREGRVLALLVTDHLS